MKVKIEITSAPDALQAIESEWQNLFNQCPNATVFQSPAWLIPWVTHFIGDTLRALIVRRSDGHLIGIAPMFLWTNETGERQLLPAGISHSDYIDCLIEPGTEQPCADAFAEFLNALSTEWDVCRFEQLAWNARLIQLWPTARRREGEPCLTLALPPNLVELPRTLPKQIRQNLTYYQNRSAKIGTVTYEVARPDSLAECLEALFCLHNACWKTRGVQGAFTDETVRSFHAEVAARCMAVGSLRLHTLRLNSKIIASAYCFKNASRTSLYLTGYDPEFKQLSPGTLIIGRAIEQAVEDGSLEFDFLRGREPYKYLWGATERPTFAIQFSNRDRPHVANADAALSPS